jgi:hypothetical protein
MGLKIDKIPPSYGHPLIKASAVSSAERGAGGIERGTFEPENLRISLT